ncbi:MAG: phosphopantetheine-binding protein [Tannerella sp.]|jgi:acyl carrier protein|nr:phosphopantetheine-binding protein [Tannerella sp.]
MDKQELISKINKVLADEFEVDVDAITPDGDIKKTLLLDSLSLVDLVALIEQDFGVGIKSAEIINIQTFSALYDYVASRVKE